MNKDKAFVSIYCKIYTDSFSDEMINVFATGKESYDFLMKDAGQCFYDNGVRIPGDCNIYYLGSNQKFGQLVLDDRYWHWSHGESSFDNVEQFVSTLYERKLVSEQQYRALMDKIKEGHLIDNMYHIKDCLVFKTLGIPWVKRSDASKFRNDMKRMVAEVKKCFEDKGYRFYQS